MCCFYENFNSHSRIAFPPLANHLAGKYGLKIIVKTEVINCRIWGHSPEVERVASARKDKGTVMLY
jgi:hypothetical protein